MNAYVYVCMYLCVYVYIYRCMYVCACMYICVHTLLLRASGGLKPVFCKTRVNKGIYVNECLCI